MIDLGTFGGDHSYAYGINDSGQVVGSAEIPSGPFHAFLYSAGIMTDLGTLYGNDTAAFDINNSGQVVGSSDTINGHFHAFFYSNNTMTDLGTFGGSSSSAFGINYSGQIVGWAETTDSKPHAFLYSNNVMTDLNDLLSPNSGWTLTHAYDINDAGAVVGYGTYNGQERAFLMNPTIVPEPISYILFVAGGTLLAGRRFIKNKSVITSRTFRRLKSSFSICE